MKKFHQGKAAKYITSKEGKNLSTVTVYLNQSLLGNRPMNSGWLQMLEEIWQVSKDEIYQVFPNIIRPGKFRYLLRITDEYGEKEVTVSLVEPKEIAKVRSVVKQLRQLGLDVAYECTKK